MNARLLLIDPDKKNHALFRDAIHQDPVHLVTADSASEAYMYSANYDYSLIVIADQLPDSRGVKLIESFKKRANTRTVPMMLSSKESASENLERECLRAGAIDYLTFPIELEVLQLKIRNILKINNEEMRLKALNDHLSDTNKSLENSFSETQSSIEYAKHILEGILPGDAKIKSIFEDYLLIHQPKDTVGGDFYMVEEVNDTKLMILGDCVGHGVPGALLAMLGSNLINYAVQHLRIQDPARILQVVNTELKRTFNETKKNNLGHDGIDMAICAYNRYDQKLYFAGAHRPMVLADSSGCRLIRGDKKSVGNGTPSSHEFECQEIVFEDNAMIYMFTDGYPDQFGGEHGKKFKVKKLVQLLDTVSQLHLEDQEDIIRESLHLWRGQLPQVDDILLVGVRPS